MLLAGDIGGTKTVLALFKETAVLQPPLHSQSFPSADYQSLEEIIDLFLAGKKADITQASFGVAGPVTDGRSQITNLNWQIEADAVSKRFGWQTTTLLNDLEAIATAVPHLTADDLFTINPGQPDPNGVIGVIAPGTGLGEAFLTWNGKRYQARPSEGGHASFAPNNEEQRALLLYLQEQYGHVSYERVCSGSGIPNLYNFLRDSGRCAEPTWLRQALESAHDPSPVIFRVAIEKKEPICQAAMRLFIQILANEAGNMGVKLLTSGGIYIGGGIPPRIAPQFAEYNFMETYACKGRFSNLLASYPIHIVRNPQAALWGAAYGANSKATSGSAPS